MINEKLLRDTLEWLTSHPESHEQAVYIGSTSKVVETRLECRTTGCIAGWTAMLSGYQPHQLREGGVTAEVVGPYMPGVDRWNSSHDPDDGELNGNLYDVTDVAQALLGLSEDEADLMFDGNNTIRDLWEYASRFTAGRIEVPSRLRDHPTNCEWSHYGLYFGFDADGNLL